MRLFQRVGAGFLIAGVLLAMGGGTHVSSGPDGTWFKVNLMHASAGIVFLLGTLSCVIAAFFGGERPKPESPSV
jgi:hypothetical protein